MIKKLLTLIVLMLFASGITWADTWTYTFKSGDISTSGGTEQFNNVSWTTAITWKNSGTYMGFDKTKGLQIGSGNNPASAASLTTSGISGTITNVTVNASMASRANVKLSISVGGTSYLKDKALTTSSANYSGTGTSSGDLVISFSNSTSKAMYIKSITVEYTAGASKSDPGLDYATKSVSVKVGKTVSNTLSNPNGLAVTYKSSDESVATVATDGTVTGVKAGTATITASFAGNDTYNAGSASYTVTVADKEAAGLAFANSTLSLEVGATDKNDLTNPHSLPVTYSSSDEGVATVAADGTVTAVAAGTATITAKTEGDDTYAAGSASYTVNVTAPKSYETVTLPYADLTLGSNSNLGKFTVEDVTNNTGKDIWAWDSKYGAKASAYSGGAKASETNLVSPIIDLGSAKKPTLTFSHAGNYFDSDPSSDLKVQIREAGSSTWTDLSVDWFSNGWTFVDNTTDLSAYAGKKVQIQFHYTSTTSAAGTWEIKNLEVKDNTTKADAGLKYSASTATATLGKAFTAPTLSNPNKLTVTYTSSNTSVATIDANGKVNILAAGTTTIKATSAETDDYKAGSASYTLTVSDPASIKVNVTATPAGGTYTSAQTVTLSAPGAAYISYTLNGTTNFWTTDQSYEIEGEKGTVTVDKTLTLKAVAYNEDMDMIGDVLTETYTITIPEPTTGDQYTLVTDLSSLADGDVITLVGTNDSGDWAKSTYSQNGDSRYYTAQAVTITDNKFPAADGITNFTIKKDASGNFRLYDTDNSGYVYAMPVKNKGYFTFEQTATDQSIVKFTDEGDNNVEIKFPNSQATADNGRIRMYFNNQAGSERFGCYSTVSYQNTGAVQLYRLVKGTTPVLTLKKAIEQNTVGDNVTITGKDLVAVHYFTASAKDKNGNTVTVPFLVVKDNDESLEPAMTDHGSAQEFLINEKDNTTAQADYD